MIVEWFESLPTIASAIVIVGGFVALTLLVGWLVGRIAPREVRMEHNDLAGFILAVVGVVYAVLLAFVAIGVWERFQAAELRSWEEAGAIGAIYRDAGSFVQQGAQIRSDLHDYAALVVDDEWPKMRHGGQSERADRLLERVDREVRSLSVTTMGKQDVQAQMLVAIDTALRDRDTRLSEDATGLNGLMWGVLLAGAVLTVGFTYLFGFRQTIMQHLMIGSLGALIGLVLFLAVALDYPFRGSITVGPEAFETALGTFSEIGR